MYELIKSSLSTYAFVAAVFGLWSLLVIYGMFKKTKDIENKKIKTARIKNQTYCLGRLLYNNMRRVVCRAVQGQSVLPAALSPAGRKSRHPSR